MLFYVVSAILIIIGISLLIFMWIRNKGWKNNYELKQRICENYAVLIPARNESNVIEGLLMSIAKQRDLKDTYVIVESEDDPTVQIVKKYDVNIIIRKDLDGKHRKGYALDEAIKEILKTKKYSLYFIIDADNIIGDNYFKEIIKIYEKGYDIVTGYHNLKNDVNVITACSCLVFSMINTLINKTSNKLKKGIIISGSGFMISGELIDKWQGFPFNTLTEDYELSLYSSANNLKTFYYEGVQYFDEQPEKYSVTITQRTRWVKGFFEARAKRLKDIKNDFNKILGVTPYIIILVGFFIAIINSIFLLIIEIIKQGNYMSYLSTLLICLGIIYITLAIFTIIILINEKDRLNISLKHKIGAVFFNPIFLLSFIRCLFKSLGNVKWETIKHGK